MEKTLNQRVGKLKNGIPGFYRTKSFRLRVWALILALALLIAGAVTVASIKANIWTGRVYVFVYSYSYYKNNLLKFDPISELLDKRDLSRDRFEEAVNLTVIERKTLTDAEIEGHGLDGIVPSAEVLHGTNTYGITRFYWVVLDGDGQCLYQGISAKDFVSTLLEAGF